MKGSKRKKFKFKLKKGDLVKVRSGNWRGMIDYISHLDPKKEIVYLKKVNQKIYDRSNADKKKKSEHKEIMIPLPISKVSYWLEDKKKITKIGFQEAEGKKIRKSRKYNIKIV